VTAACAPRQTMPGSQPDRRPQPARRPRPARRPQAKSLLLDLYGAFVRDLGGWIAVADLVRLLGDLGVDEQAARSSVSRLLRRGLLARRRIDGRAGYELTAEAEEILAEGDRRIFAATSPADLADGWALAVFSVPERQRGRRHQLRAQLLWHGFGNLGAGVWLAPHRALDAARVVVERLGLTDCVELFSAHHAAFGELGALVARCWDLDDLGARYAAFVAEVTPVVARWRRGRGPGGSGRGVSGGGVSGGGVSGAAGVSGGSRDRAAFVDYTCLLHEWRKMPFLDPGLPPEVLPDNWQGRVAAERFGELVDLLHEPAARYVAAVMSARSEWRSRR
jgi:phenylacetic acid degradation operon negative regulatory protein